jgi:predicted DNA-binding protein (UPF0251 family)
MKRKCAGRPKHYRWIEKIPEVTHFKPSGVQYGRLEQVNLAVDELEAIRLADLEGLYQEQAAELINVSRQTFGRIITSAHKKVAEALVMGKSILIEGGEIVPSEESRGMRAGGHCICPKCDERIVHQRGVPCQEEKCPKCGQRMMREGSYHHEKILKKKSEQGSVK